MASQYFVIEEVKEMPWPADEYGNIVTAVKMNGILEGALIRTQTKNKPNVGDKIYGHLELAKTGKSHWLKKDKLPEDFDTVYGEKSFTSNPASAPPEPDSQLDRIEAQLDTLTTMVSDMGLKLENPTMPDDFLKVDE